MMRCCAFGTVRMDIHIYDQLTQLKDCDEIKVNDMVFKVGGSVYNTVAVLNELKQNIVFYTLNITDDVSDYLKLKMINRSIAFVTSKHEKNSTATSIIFVSDDGNKKMISYDGKRQDSHILKKLLINIGNYDLFYTSFYEINRENLDIIIEVMHNSCQCFVDLTPLIYEAEASLLDSVLANVQILSGTDEEYNTLLMKLNISSIEELFETYRFLYLFVKQGGKGASLYYPKGVINCSPDDIKKSRDTTGCGDTFNAGVIYALSQGYNEKDMLKKAVELASIVAYNGFDLDLFDC